MKTKTILGALALGGVAFYLYKRKKDGKSLNPFAKSSSFAGDEGFFNLTQVGYYTSCQTFSGNAGYVGMPVGSNGVIVATGNGRTIVCPKGQSSNMPIKYN
jgi:hypothetical protein